MVMVAFGGCQKHKGSCDVQGKDLFTNTSIALGVIRGKVYRVHIETRQDLETRSGFRAYSHGNRWGQPTVATYLLTFFVIIS